MALSVDLIGTLESPLSIAGFERLIFPGLIPPRSIWLRSAKLLSGAPGRTAIALDIHPVGRQGDFYAFQPTLTLNGTPLAERFAVTTWYGTVADFVDRELPAYLTLFELEDFYERGSTASPIE